MNKLLPVTVILGLFVGSPVFADNYSTDIDNTYNSETNSETNNDYGCYQCNIYVAQQPRFGGICATQFGSAPMAMALPIDSFCYVQFGYQQIPGVVR